MSGAREEGGVFVRGRKHPYVVLNQTVIDGLLELEGVALAGLYMGMCRFIDRREGAQIGETMDWTVHGFCRKFRIGKERFYRQMDILWRVGLVDVEKEVCGKGWRNRYVVHDFPEYEGPLRQIRNGSFRRRQGPASSCGEEQREQDEGIPGQAGIPDEGIPQTGIPDEEIPQTGIPEQGIPQTGIPVQDLPRIIQPTNTTTRDNTTTREKDKLPYGACGVNPGMPSNSPPPDDRTLIAELTSRFHKLPGVPKLRGHYALVGRAYREFGYEVVAAAIEDLEFEMLGRQQMGLPEIGEKELAKVFFARCKWNWKDPALRREENPARECISYRPEVIGIEEWCRRHGLRVVPGTNRVVRADSTPEKGAASDA